MAMYEAADRGEVTMAEAELLVGILLSAAADTTVITLANTLRAFSEFPAEFQRVKAEPSLCKAAFEESLRWDSPSRMAGRITMRDIEIEDYVIPSGTRLRTDVCGRQPRSAPLARTRPLRCKEAEYWPPGFRFRRACLRGPRAGAARSRSTAGRSGGIRHQHRGRGPARALDDHHRPWAGEAAGQVAIS